MGPLKKLVRSQASQVQVPDHPLSLQVPQRMAVAEGTPEDSGGGSPGVWGSWGPWSACSRSCSGGVMEQTRPCLPSSYRGRGGSRPSGPMLPFTGHVVSAVRTSVPLHRSREEQRALIGSNASRPGSTMARGSRHPQARSREPSERRYGPCVCPCLEQQGPLPSLCRVGGVLVTTARSVHEGAGGGHRAASGMIFQAKSIL